MHLDQKLSSLRSGRLSIFSLHTDAKVEGQAKKRPWSEGVECAVLRKGHDDEPSSSSKLEWWDIKKNI